MLSLRVETMKILVTTNPGIEDLVEEELWEVFGECIKRVEYEGIRGRLIFSISDCTEYMVEKIYTMTMIHRAGVLVTQGRVSKSKDGLNDVFNAIYSSDIYEHVTPYMKFAIRAERIGKDHEYTSIDIARVAGDAVIEAVKKKYGVRPRVDLDYPDIVVHVDVVEDSLYVYIAFSGDISMHRRGYRIYDHPAALKPTLAAAMIRLSKATDGETIMDSMCGGGTIPIEAALTFENTHQICMDINPVHVKGAKMNAIAANVYNRIEFMVGDASKIHEYVKTSIDRIISNPPYGIRVGNPRAIRELYKEFIINAPKVLSENATITLITTEHKVVEETITDEGSPLVKIHERVVSHGNLWPKIMVLRVEKP